jgi:hypothetical protein
MSRAEGIRSLCPTFRLRRLHYDTRPRVPAGIMRVWVSVAARRHYLALALRHCLPWQVSDRWPNVEPICAKSNGLSDPLTLLQSCQAPAVTRP